MKLLDLWYDFINDYITDTQRSFFDDYTAFLDDLTLIAAIFLTFITVLFIIKVVMWSIYAISRVFRQY